MRQAIGNSLCRSGPIYGEEVQAAVVPRADVTAAELHAYSRSRLSDFKVPKVIYVVKELPRDSRGKVERFHLKELFSK
jgi:acyl-coenzyme A synthetase/AMP-(fatty) acid ligase